MKNNMETTEVIIDSTTGEVLYDPANPEENGDKLINFIFDK